MDLQEKIELITRISLDLNQVKDLDILLERILANVRLFLNADAGSIYLKEGDRLRFSHSQNNTLQNIIPFPDYDQPLVIHFASNAGLAIERAQATRNTLLRMISMAELRDPKETGAHVNRVGAYSVEIYEAWARAAGIPEEDIEHNRDLLRMAAMLHDVGKVAISDIILKKPARLTIDEFEIIKSHTWLGAGLFKDGQSDFDSVAMEVALNHHEKWDGTGYPGLNDEINELHNKLFPGEDTSHTAKKGKDIPLFGRIVAIADVYDALCSQRVYKKPWDEYEIINEIKKSSGRHFDPDIVAAFFRCYDILKNISQKYPDHQ
ncbi:MAG: HD domain-containing protein [Deltaproteobacteria bacterium]|nr:HD domain-containing protein [Deltaproteobacteria bacterium]